MPIRFRCGYCNRLLGIARRKAGTDTTCPHCGYIVTVPEEEPPATTQEAADQDDRTELDDLEALLNAVPPAGLPPPSPKPAPANSAAAPRSQPSASLPATHVPLPAAAARPPKAGSTTTSAPKPDPGSEDRPLFERDLDAVLSAHHKEAGPETESRPKQTATSGMDALSLEPDRGQLVLSVHKATVLAVAVVILLALSFTAGFLVASAK